MKNRIFIGAAWPYANNSLHLGHAVALIGAESSMDGEVEVEDDSLDREKLQLQGEKQKEDAALKRQQLQETVRSNKVNEEIKRKVANKKPAATTK